MGGGILRGYRILGTGAARVLAPVAGEESVDKAEAPRHNRDEHDERDDEKREGQAHSIQGRIFAPRLG
jgi:hypothetical protein